MLWVQALDMVTWQWILVSRRGIFAVKPRLIPILRVTRQACIREDGISSTLNRYSAKFQAGPVRELILAVQVKIFPKEVDAGLLLKVTSQKT